MNHIQLKWTDDKAAEQTMTDMGLEWKIKTIPVKKINEELSKINRARHGNPILSATVERYSFCMTRKDVFPRLVVGIDALDNYIILGGNQRFFAAKPLTDQIEVYLIDYDKGMENEIFRVLPKLLNLKHGERLPDDTALTDAITFVTEGTMSIGAASEHFKISRDKIRNTIDVGNLMAILDNHGVRYESTKESVILKLKKISPESVMVAAAKVMVGYGCTQADMDELISEIEANQKTESSMLAVCQKRLDLLKDRTVISAESRKRRKKAVLLDLGRLVYALDRLESVLGDKTSLSDFKFKGSAKKHMSLRLKEIAKRLHKIACT